MMYMYIINHDYMILDDLSPSTSVFIEITTISSQNLLYQFKKKQLTLPYTPWIFVACVAPKKYGTSR